MRFSVLVLCVAAGAAALTGSAASAHDGYGRGYGYGGIHAPYGWYQRGPVTNGYYGRPRFFRGWRDRVSGYDDPYNLGSYYPYGAAGYLPDSIGPYLENRGYGVEGRGWQAP
jgi:hypothetical protein